MCSCPCRGPVSTISSGRSRRLRRSGSALPRSAGPVRDVDVVAAVAGQRGGDWWIGHAAVLGILGGLVSVWRRAPAACASSAASPRRTGPSSMSITCAASVARPRLAAARRTAPAGSWTRPSVRITETGAATAVAARLAPDDLLGQREPFGERGAPAGRQPPDRLRGELERGAGRDEQMTLAIAERHHGHAVAPRVGIAQQLEQRALDAREPRAGAHRAAGIHDQAEQHALATSAHVLAQRARILARERAPAASRRSRCRCCRASRAGCRSRPR